MQVLEIKDIQRDEVPLYYRMKYIGVAVIELPLKTIETHIDFAIETNPLGIKTIDVEIDKTIEYPLVPLVKALRAFIIKLDDEGHLLENN